MVKSKPMKIGRDRSKVVLPVGGTVIKYLAYVARKKGLLRKDETVVGVHPQRPGVEDRVILVVQRRTKS